MTYLSRNAYPATSGVTTFAITFPYLSRDDVKVTLNGTAHAFTFANDGLIVIDPAPSGDLLVYRETPVASRLVSYSNTAFLRDSNLNKADLQYFYLIQESYDRLQDLLGAGGDVPELTLAVATLRAEMDQAKTDIDDIQSNVAFNYYTKAEVEALANSYYTNPELDAMFEADQLMLDNHESRIDALELDLSSNYYTTSEIDAQLADLALSGVNWRGVWDSFNSYAINDAVSYNGSSFIAKVPVDTGGLNPLLSSASWDMLAAKGDAGGSAFGARLYFQDVPASGIPGYFSLVTTYNDSTERVKTAVVNSTTGDVLLAAYITEPGFPGLTVFPSGKYEFRMYRNISDTGGTTQLVLKVYKRTVGGTEVLLVEKLGVDINDTTTAVEVIEHFGPGTTPLNTDDRLVVKVYARSTSGASRTVNFLHSGSANASHINTPFSVSADGKSAYEVAVDNGFIGTEAEWLASLAGDAGPAGPTGPTGPAGAAGATGPAGPAGSGQIGGHAKFGSAASAPSGEWIVPAGVTRIRARLWGGGGSAAKPASGYTPGAGGGAYTEAIVAVTAGATLLYTVGAGGPGKTTVSDGNSGASTTLGGSGFSLVASGGNAGTSSGYGDGGSTATQTGDSDVVNVIGGAGGRAFVDYPGYGGASPSGGTAAYDGPSRWPGGGGSGTGSSVDSGNGANGLIIIDY